MKVYLDVCCLARLTDDQSQLRIREEAMAVERIFTAISQGKVQWISSAAVAEEIAQNPSPQRRAETEALLIWTADSIEIDRSIASELTDSSQSATEPLTPSIWLRRRV